MSLPDRFPADVTYCASDGAIAVRVNDMHQAMAVQAFAQKHNFAFPAPSDARPVFHCSAKTHPNSEVLWA
jgi:hypothetical protein